MVGAGLAWVWPMLAVVAGAVSAGLAGVAAACWVGACGAGLAASVAGFAGSGAGFATAAVVGLAMATSAGSAGFAASGLGLGTGTLRLATCGADAGGFRLLRSPGAGGSGPGGP